MSNTRTKNYNADMRTFVLRMKSSSIKHDSKKLHVFQDEYNPDSPSPPSSLQGLSGFI